MDENNLKLEIIDAYKIKVFQDPRYFKFSIDAFCLAEFTSSLVKKKDNYIDLCSGSGIVGILLAKTLSIDQPIFVEINPHFAKVNKKNLGINNINGQVINIDLRQLSQYFANETVDFMTINPPYMVANSGLKTKNSKIDLAKIEADDSFLSDVFAMSHKLLKDRGELFMVHQVNRLADIFYYSRLNKMEPKTLQLIRNKNRSKASLVLLRFVKNANRFLKTLDDYII